LKLKNVVGSRDQPLLLKEETKAVGSLEGWRVPLIMTQKGSVLSVVEEGKGGYQFLL
jgi:hypothetical protein